MEEISVSVTNYKCSYCGCTSSSLDWMARHEEGHRMVDNIAIGQSFVYNFDSGNTRKGTVIKKDVFGRRLLVEADNGERDWTGLLNIRELF